MNFIVKHFPATGTVLIQGMGMTVTFHVREREDIEEWLKWLGFQRVMRWVADGAHFRGDTERNQRAAA